ncbi:PepSY domain-containing protein [Pelistega europaea]|uniref:PepSY domain-containing protein n=1 Tax=Pelistega europaea TaxID=106147 RepID=A0A7Y4P4S4_9BURK|nr:PepSY domain-containing protein [Pelistega europaea]NOL49801.1 PepSY domain-containing protein [Pelistega europaea]
MFKQILFASVIASFSSVALASTQCTHYPENERIPSIQFQQKLQQEGYHIKKFEIDDNCYEIEGTNAKGERVEINFDMKTGQAVKSKIKH